jgi:5-methylthioadenosine/S-adenosylhomocysteine deaminase
MTADDLIDSARLGALEALRAGVTTCADTCDSGAALDALIEAGLGGTVYQEIFGPSPEQAIDSMRKLEEKVAALEERRGVNGMVRVGVSPHAPYTVSAALFERVTEFALATNRPVAIHAAESEPEELLVRSGKGYFAERLAGRGIHWETPGTSTIEYLKCIGVLDSKPLLIHAVRATDDDLESVFASGSSIVHCPKSNAKFGHGVARVADMRRRGIPVGLGTDSVASNNVCDLLDEGRVAVFAARAVGCDPEALTARDAIRMATLDGARALGVNSEIGSLEPGKRADLCCVSLSGLHASPVYDVETALVFSTSRHDVTMTMAAGRILHDASGGSECGLDEERLRARLGEIHRRVKSK